MRILWNNFLTPDTTVYPYSENPNYPASNLADYRLTRLYQTNGLSTNEYFDFAYTGVPEYVSLIEHNISSSAILYVEGGSSSGLSTLTFSETLTWNSGIIISTITSTASCDYFRIRVEGLSTTSQSYVTIGYVFLGEYIELPGMKPDQAIKDETTSRVTISDGGQAYGDFGYNYRAPEINFPYITHTQRASIRTMFSSVRNYIPVISIIWPDQTDVETPIYGVIDQTNLEFKKTGEISFPWSVSFKLREVF